MRKRMVLTMMGLGAGIALGGYAVRKVERARASLSPDALAAAAARRAGSVRDHLTKAIAAGRVAAAAREAELRSTYGIGEPRA